MHFEAKLATSRWPACCSGSWRARLEGVRAGSEPPDSQRVGTSTATTDATETTVITAAPTETTVETTAPDHRHADERRHDVARSVTVAAVCVDGVTPAVDVTSTGTGDVAWRSGRFRWISLRPNRRGRRPGRRRTVASPASSRSGTPFVSTPWRCSTLVFDLGTVDVPANCPATGLTNGVRYYFRVFAKNAAGTSPRAPP